MFSPRPILLVLLVFAACIGTTGLALAGYMVTDLGPTWTVPQAIAPGLDGNPGAALNVSGQAAWTGLGPSGVGPSALLFSAGSTHELGASFGIAQTANAINAASSVVGTDYVGAAGGAGGSYSLPQAALFQHGKVTLLGGLGGISVFGSPQISSSANGINNQGQIVGSSSTSSGDTHAFLYSHGKMLDLGVLGQPPGGLFGPVPSNSTALGINNAGQVVGSSTTNSGQTHAFLYSHGKMLDLGALGSTNQFGPGIAYSSANGINGLGQVVGSSTTSSGPLHAFLYSHGKMIDLGSLDHTQTHLSLWGLSSAYGINDQGQVVGASITDHGDTHAFLYSNGKMSDLNQLLAPHSGWTLYSADGINARGQIVAYGVSGNAIPGTRPGGVSIPAQPMQVVLLTPTGGPSTGGGTPPPRATPGSLTLLGLGLLGLGGYGWRRTRRG